MPAGTEAYSADVPPVLARGATYSGAELGAALAGPVSDVLSDTTGTLELEGLLAGVATTEFDVDGLRGVLSQPVETRNWRVGEAMAEAFLSDHRGCRFPWPSGRDQKNPDASPAGTDLVGFQQVDGRDDCRFAFGEVKTSAQEQWPPSVVEGRHGLAAQLEVLMDSRTAKDNLVRYLGLRATNAPWSPDYMSAVKRYAADCRDVSLFGVLIRDVEPKVADLKGRAKSLSKSRPPSMSIELRAMYLPSGSVDTLAERAAEAKEGGG